MQAELIAQLLGFFLIRTVTCLTILYQLDVRCLAVGRILFLFFLDADDINIALVEQGGGELATSTSVEEEANESPTRNNSTTVSCPKDFFLSNSSGKCSPLCSSWEGSPHGITVFAKATLIVSVVVGCLTGFLVLVVSWIQRGRMYEYKGECVSITSLACAFIGTPFLLSCWSTTAWLSFYLCVSAKCNDTSYILLDH